MNKQLSDAIARIRELPEERQEAAAALLNDFLAGDADDFELTPEQIAEIELALRENEYATQEEAEAFFAQFKK
jgi:hypothetical protein